jgi:hypothetical protein
MPPRQTVEVSPVPVRAEGGGGGGGFTDKIRAHPIMTGTVLAGVAIVGFLIYKKVKGNQASTTTPTTTQSTTSQPYYSGSRNHHFNQGTVSSSNAAGTTTVGSTGNIGSGSGSGGGSNGQWVPPVVGAYTSGAQSSNVSPSGAAATTTPQPVPSQPSQGITQQAWTVPTPYASDTVSNPQQIGMAGVTDNGSSTALPSPQNSTAQLPANPTGGGEPDVSSISPSTTPQTRQSQRAARLAARRVAS